MTFRTARVHELHPGPLKGLDVRGELVAAGGPDGTLHLLTDDGRRLEAPQTNDDLINAVAIGPAGQIATASRDRRVRIHDPAVPRTYTVGEHDHWVMDVAWSDDGSRVATASEDGTIGLWEPDGAAVTRIDLGGPVNGISWRGDVVAAIGGGRALHLLDGDGALLWSVDGASQLLWDVAISPDGARVAWTGRDRLLRITPLEGGETTIVPAHTAQVWSVAWDEAGDRLATASADGTVAVWSAATEARERIPVGAWARRALFRGQELFVATEAGDLQVFADAGVGDAETPVPIVIPDPPETCSHWDPQVEDAGWRPRCAECGSFEEPRLCVTCGHVGCCESQFAHGTKHWLETGHPNTVPAIAGPFSWRWCYEDDMYVKRT